MTGDIRATGDYDDYQIPLPASFQALHADARGRLLAPLDAVRARYEWCEDLAQLLVERVGSEQPQDSWRDQERLLGLCRAGLGDGREAGATQSAAEADWIVRRLAELLGWAAPDQATAER